MRLEHEFTVPAPIDQVWRALIDPELVAPCMPGATLTNVEGSAFSGTVKVKVGPISLLYKGKGEFLDIDDAAHKVTIKAGGKDSRGNGTAAATVTVTLTESAGATHGEVETDLNITGKPAQFGRGMIADVSGKILNTFAECLASKLTTEQPAPAAPPQQKTDQAQQVNSAWVDPAKANQAASARSAQAEPANATQASSPRGTDPTPAINLLDYSGSPLTKRAIPAAIAFALLAALFAILRHKRARK